MSRTVRLLVGCLVLAMAVASCNKVDYDHNTAVENVKATFHNDTVDARHTWCLITEYIVGVRANVENVQRVELLTANPYVAEAELLNRQTVEAGDVASLNYSVATIQDSVYAAAVTADGTYHVVAMPCGQTSVDFSRLNTTNSGTLQTIHEQEVYYCYCNSYPEPGTTWDFNDLVLRISKRVVDDYTLRIGVTVAAVGTTIQEAAAIRLYGIKYSDVESVTATRDFVRNTDLPRYIIKDTDLLLQGSKGEAVVNLFDDAHAVFYSRLSSNGSLLRPHYNVSHSTGNGYSTFAESTVSFDVKFKREGLASLVNFEMLDPFIVYAYNGILVEAHKYLYQQDEVLFSYFTGNPQDYRTGFTWVLEIPYQWFRYPREGNAMGSYKRGALYGCYQQPYHSFGEWAAHSNMAQDWYLYPNTSMVY